MPNYDCEVGTDQALANNTAYGNGIICWLA